MTQDALAGPLLQLKARRWCLRHASKCICAKPCERMPQVRNCCNSSVTCLGRQLPESVSAHIRSNEGRYRAKTW
jgi:hypothetical protein